MVAEDNSGAIEITRINKYWPRSKHLNNRLHHFWGYVDTTKGLNIRPINMKYHPAGMLPRAHNVELLNKFWKIIVGW